MLLLSLLLSDENALAIGFGAAYLFVGLIYVLIVGLLIALYTGSGNSTNKKLGLCFLAVASSFCTFSIGIGMGTGGGFTLPLFLNVGFPLLVVILALIKPTEWFRWPKSASQPAAILQLLLRLILFGAVLLLLAFYWSLPATVC
jgi:hypothetical protein